MRIDSRESRCDSPVPLRRNPRTAPTKSTISIARAKLVKPALGRATGGVTQIAPIFFNKCFFASGFGPLHIFRGFKLNRERSEQIVFSLRRIGFLLRIEASRIQKMHSSEERTQNQANFNVNRREDAIRESRAK